MSHCCHSTCHQIVLLSDIFIHCAFSKYVQVTEKCNHVFCKTCFTGYKCPTCSMPLTAGVKYLKLKNVTTSLIKGYGADSILDRINLEDFQTSTKIEALVCGFITF